MEINGWFEENLKKARIKQTNKKKPNKQTKNVWNAHILKIIKQFDSRAQIEYLRDLADNEKIC